MKATVIAGNMTHFFVERHYCRCYYHHYTSYRRMVIRLRETNSPTPNIYSRNNAGNPRGWGRSLEKCPPVSSGKDVTVLL
jgi:hypothetical protein